MNWTRTAPDELARARETLADLVTASLEEALDLVASGDRDARQEDLLGFIAQAADAARAMQRLP